MISLGLQPTQPPPPSRPLPVRQYSSLLSCPPIPHLHLTLTGVPLQASAMAFMQSATSCASSMREAPKQPALATRSLTKHKDREGQ